MKTFLYLCTRYMYVYIFGTRGMVRDEAVVWEDALLV
jgi:hypothetical protein